LHNIAEISSLPVMDLFFSEVIILVTFTSFVGPIKKESIGLLDAEVVVCMT